MTQSVTHGIPRAVGEKNSEEIEEKAPTFRKKTVHHATKKFNFVLNAEIDEVGVYQYAIWGD